MSAPTTPSELRFGPSTTPLTHNETIDLQLRHRSVRSFTDRPVDASVISTLIAVASSTASSNNLQLWSVVVVGDRERLAVLARLAGNQDAVRDAQVFLVWVADYARAARITTAHGREPVNADLAEATLLSVVDTALAAQNAVIAAESLGLGTVYIGGIRNNPDGVAVALELPNRVFPVVGLAIGYPATDTSIKPRLPASVVAHSE